MTLNVCWHDAEKTITRIDFEGQFSIEDVYVAWAEELQLMRSVTHPVYSLNYVAPVGVVSYSFTGRIRELREFVEKNRAPNLQMTVQVAPNRMVRGVLRTIARMMPHTVYVIETYADAHAIINVHKQVFAKTDTVLRQFVV